MIPTMMRRRQMPMCRIERCVGSFRQASRAAAALPMSRSQNTGLGQLASARKDIASLSGLGLMRQLRERAITVKITHIVAEGCDLENTIRRRGKQSEHQIMVKAHRQIVLQKPSCTGVQKF
jgi:hypothetical protein